ncbi:uncharacterized protein K460DRAFT_266505, partial [Cucurbitaria berberidis CBS 394.84]
LAPEIRNNIYRLLLRNSLPFFIEPALQKVGTFKLYEVIDKTFHNIIATLQALSYVSHELRQEARIYFYSVNSFAVLCYGYEYLPVLVRWLESLGSECRAMLKRVKLYGSMWYQPSLPLTQRLHDLLRERSNVQHLTLQHGIRHFCESDLSGLNAYFNYTGSEPHDSPLPEVDVSLWTQTIADMSKLQSFELQLI